jgi:hypothetical protein
MGIRSWSTSTSDAGWIAGLEPGLPGPADAWTLALARAARLCQPARNADTCRAMNPPDDLRTNPPVADALPAHTTPTWEVELLISGVAVFAMLQLPGWLDDKVMALLPRLDTTWSKFLPVLFIYAKGAAMILAATFVIHLLLRARWIALVGMNSVYPQGILWDRLRIGPLQRQLETERDPGMPSMIERADNRATVVFAIGVMMATMIVTVALGLTAVFVVIALARQQAGLQINVAQAIFMAMLLVMLPWLAAVQADRFFGDRLAAGGFVRRLLTAVLRAYSRIGLARGSNPTMALLSSHGGERRMVVLTIVLMFVAIGGAAISFDFLRAPGHFGSYSLFPSSTASTSASEHYDDERNPARGQAVPYIQSAIVPGPYLKLVVPYQPGRDDMALRHACPTILLKDEEQSAAALACLAHLHAVNLDGKPLTGLRYEVSDDARTDRPALLAVIDLRGLAPGRHELVVARPAKQLGGNDSPDDSGADDSGADDRKGRNDAAYRIAFWH